MTFLVIEASTLPFVCLSVVHIAMNKSANILCRTSS